MKVIKRNSYILKGLNRLLCVLGKQLRSIIIRYMSHNNQQNDKHTQKQRKSLNFARELCLRLKVQIIQQKQLTQSVMLFFNPLLILLTLLSFKWTCQIRDNSKTKQNELINLQLKFKKLKTGRIKTRNPLVNY